MGTVSASIKSKDVQTRKGPVDGWNRILAAAEEAERLHRNRLRAIRRSIATIRTKIATGEPLPEGLKIADER